MRLAVKVQFPGVRQSIKSDLSNLKWLLIAGAVLPRGLYLENTIKVMESELEDECDYLREAECGIRMRKLLETDDRFAAPLVVRELCGPMVLATEMMAGEPLTMAIGYDQATRDAVRPCVLTNTMLILSRLERAYSSSASRSYSSFASCRRIRIGATFSIT